MSIGSLVFTIKDRGARAGADHNVCFYLSCTDDNQAEALALKARLVKSAAAFARARGSPKDFATLGQKAEEAVFLSGLRRQHGDQ